MQTERYIGREKGRRRGGEKEEERKRGENVLSPSET